MADRVELKLTGLDNVVDALRRLPPHVVSKRGGPVLSALKKGARVIHKAAKINLVANTDGDESTGLLEKNLIVSRGKKPIGGNGERVLVRVRKKVYKRTGKETVTTYKSAQLLEYGSSQQPAEPWLRPAFQGNAENAIRTIESSMLSEIERFMSRALKKAR